MLNFELYRKVEEYRAVRITPENIDAIYTELSARPYVTEIEVRRVKDGEHQWGRIRYWDGSQYRELETDQLMDCDFHPIDDLIHEGFTIIDQARDAETGKKESNDDPRL